MKRALVRRTPAPCFDAVRRVVPTLPDVTLETKYDGTPVLRLDGAFVAGLASHVSAEPDTLIVRMDVEDRELLLEEAADVYYVTEYYRPYPVVLVRLSRVGDEALRDLLRTSWRLTVPKGRNNETKRSATKARNHETSTVQTHATKTRSPRRR